MRYYTRTSIILLLFSLLTVTAMAESSSRVFSNYSAADGLADNSAQTIACTKTGRLVVTTMGQINFYDGQKFTFIDPSEENIYPLANYYGNYHLYFDHYHHLWLKDTHSVTCVNLTIEKFTSSIEEEFKKFGMDKKVLDLFVDSNGIVWMLTDDGLFSAETKQTLKIRRDLNLQDLDVYKKQLLLFYENGLMEIYDSRTQQKLGDYQSYSKNDVELYKKSSVLHFDGDKLYQLRNGQKEAILQRFDFASMEWKELLRTPYHLNNLAEKDSLIYIPSEYGYWIYDIVNGKPIHIEGLLLSNGKLLQTDVNVMVFDRQGGLWAGTEKRGLLYSKPYNSPFTVHGWNEKEAVQYAVMMDGMDKPVTFRNKSVNCLFRDSRGWTWVGTSQGLRVYEKSSDMLPRVISKKDGLYNNVIHAVVEDKMHNIWVSTSYGVSCILFKDGQIDYINSYNMYDKIPNESFVNGRALCLPDGKIVMQALDHVVSFSPEEMQTLRNAYPFNLYPKLIRLMVNGNEISTGQEYDGNVILEKALTRTGEINLNYNQNSLSLVFSALNYFRPQQTYYRVRINGLDDQWHVFAYYNSDGMVDSKGLFHLPMIGLRPGTYVIELQASMTPNDWGTTPYQWIINVNEPWWRASGLFVIFGILLSILALVNVFFYLRNANLRAMRNSEEQVLLKRIITLADRCSGEGNELLEPIPEDIMGLGSDAASELSPEFIKMMEHIVPFVQSKKTANLTMRQLSSEAGLGVQEFYSLVSENIYKSPRPLIRKMMTDRAEELLKTTSKTIGEISEQCGFVTPNFFIATFYRYHRQTPAEFRGKL